ncbi:MAG: DNA-directed RNA polymerase [Ignisphaera sp.]
MFRIYRLRDIVRIDPSKIDRPLEETAFDEIRKKYEGLRDRNLGIVVAITNIKVDPMGVLPLGDGAPHYRVVFDALTYIPVINEVGEGPVEVLGRMGLTVRVGPIEGFIHISQVADDEVSYDPARNMVICKNSKRFVMQGDMVRARITSISLGTPQRLPRVSMTMRQPYLGKIEWLSKSK